MTAQTRGRIRHVALSVKDPWETAEFYKQAVGLQEVTELDGPLAEGVFLTDGVVNLAILHFKSDEASQGTGADFVGIHHIGFWVDDVVEQGKIARNASSLDPATRTVLQKGKLVELTSVEFNLLHVLLREAGRVVPRERLVDRLSKLDSSPRA